MYFFDISMVTQMTLTYSRNQFASIPSESLRKSMTRLKHYKATKIITKKDEENILKLLLRLLVPLNVMMLNKDAITICVKSKA